MASALPSLAQVPFYMNFDSSLPNRPFLTGLGDGAQLLAYQTTDVLTLFPSERAFHHCNEAFKQFGSRYLALGPFPDSMLASFSVGPDFAYKCDAQLVETMQPAKVDVLRLSMHMLHCLAHAQVYIPFSVEGREVADGPMANFVTALSPSALLNDIVNLAQTDVRMMQSLRRYNGHLQLSAAEIGAACGAVLMPGDVSPSDSVDLAIASVLSNQANKDQVNCSKSATDAAAEKKRMGQARDRQNRGDAQVHGRPAISRDRSRSPLDRRTKRAEQHVKASRTAPRYTASDLAMPNDAERREMASRQREQRLQRRRIGRGASPGAETPEPETPPPPKRPAAAPSCSRRSASPPLPAANSPQRKRRAPAPEASAVKAPPPLKRRAPVSPPPAAKASPQQPKRRRVAAPEAPQGAPVAVRKSGRERKQRMNLKQVEAEVDEASPPQKILTPRLIMAPQAPVPRPMPMAKPTLVMIDPAPSGSKGEKSLLADAIMEESIPSPALANFSDVSDEQPQDNSAIPALSPSSASQPILNDALLLRYETPVQETASDSGDRELLQLKEAFALITQRGQENVDEPIDDVMMPLIRSSTPAADVTCHHCDRCFATVRGQRIHAAKVHKEQLRQSAILDEIAKRASAGLPPLRRSQRIQKKTLDMAENRTR